MTIDKYVGRLIEMIYQNGKGELSQRVVKVRSVKNGQVQVFDLGKQEVRTLKLDGILAIQPVTGRRVS